MVCPSSRRCLWEKVQHHLLPPPPLPSPPLTARPHHLRLLLREDGEGLAVLPLQREAGRRVDALVRQRLRQGGCGGEGGSRTGDVGMADQAAGVLGATSSRVTRYCAGQKAYGEQHRRARKRTAVQLPYPAIPCRTLSISAVSTRSHSHDSCSLPGPGEGWAGGEGVGAK